jgi:hypothetical protein
MGKTGNHWLDSARDVPKGDEVTAILFASFIDNA